MYELFFNQGEGQNKLASDGEHLRQNILAPDGGILALKTNLRKIGLILKLKLKESILFRPYTHEALFYFSHSAYTFPIANKPKRVCT